MTQQFTPDLINNLAFWFEPSRTGGAFKDAAKSTPCAADGDVIWTLADLSGNGYDAVQATTANQPLYKTAGGFGLPCARFNGTSSYLSLGQPAGLDLLQYGGITFCAVLNMTSALPAGAFNTILLGKFASGTETRIGLGINTNGSAYRYSQVSSLGSGPSLFIAGQKSILTYRMRLLNETLVNGAAGTLQLAQEEFWINGHRVLSMINSVAGWDTSHDWTLGALEAGFYWAGDIALTALYGRDLTDSEIGQIHAYASNRYGALNKPYSTQQGNKTPLRAHVSCVGTSITQGVPNYATSYPLQMEALLPYARVYDFGRGSQQSPSFVSVAASREDQFIDPSLTNVAVLESGTNDLAFNINNVSAAYANAQTWAAARRAAGYKYVIGCTMLPRNGGSGNFSNGQTISGFETDRQSYNALMRADTTTWDYIVDVGSSTAISINGQVVDVSVLGAPSAYSNSTYFQQGADQTHLTQAGYARYAAAVAAAVNLVAGAVNSSLHTAKDNADVAALVLSTPANKLVTDGSGRVGVNNFPSEVLTSAEQASLAADTPAAAVTALLGASFLTIPSSHTTSGVAETLTYKQWMALQQSVLQGDDVPTVPTASGSATESYYLVGQPAVSANLVAVSTVTYDANLNQTGRTVKIVQPFPAVS